MPLWDNTRFDNEAKNLATTWHGGRTAGGGSLTELVTKVARDASLNPEQIERLARITNGHAFNAVFETAKTAKEKDRYPDFDVADAKAVIASLYESAADPHVIKTAAYAPLDDQFAPLRSRPDPLAERYAKLADDRSADTIERAVREPSLMVQYHNLKAAAAETHARMAGAEMRWNDALVEMRKVASYVGWKRDDFEYNALALYGSEALPEINLLRKEAGLDLVRTSTEKVAEFQNRHIGEESPMTNFLKTAIDRRADYAKWKGAYGVASAKLAEVKGRVYGAS